MLQTVIKKTFGPGAVIVLLLQASAYAADPALEVVLKAPLDEAQGYCIDVVGSQARANISRPLQAHSCYSYQGRVAVDQGFDGAGLQAGSFRLVYFNVCMTAVPREGGLLGLAACSDDLGQSFAWSPSGAISPRGAAELCVTVTEGSGTPGNGGSPIHLRRRLSLERCDASRTVYQSWRARAVFDGAAGRLPGQFAAVTRTGLSRKEFGKSCFNASIFGRSLMTT
eukprot:gene10959-11041_t